MRRTVSRTGAAEDQELRLHRFISALMREFRLEPGMLAGSPYADLHSADIGLFEVLSESQAPTVREIADLLRAPISTVSSALDRLERDGLVRRTRKDADRRVVRIEVTAKGKRLAAQLNDAHVANCRNMLQRLGPSEREEFLQLVAKIARPAEIGG
jgi:DNA-binding MarR family transcriptional regulator